MVSLIHQTIPQSRYISTTTIISADDANSSQRELIGRVFDTNEMLPCGRVVEFTDVDAVRNYFGIQSDGADYDETIFAEKYFSFVNTDGNSPTRIAFARWQQSSTSNAYLMSRNVEKRYQTIAQCKNNTIIFTYQLSDGVEKRQQSITFDFSNIMSIRPQSGIYSLIDGINDAFLACSSILKSCVASFVDDKLVITFPSEVKYVYACSGVPYKDSDGMSVSSVAHTLGLTASEYVVASNYCERQTADEAVEASINVSDNFGSFCFLSPNSTQTEKISFAESISAWMADRQYEFFYVQRLSFGEGTTAMDNIETYISKLVSRKGIHIVVSSNNNDYDYEESVPMAILSCIDYESDGGGQKNWMFQSNANINPPVNIETWASLLDSLNVNYLGLTQKVAQERYFYQCGKNVDGELASVYCAELWLRYRIKGAIADGFVGSEKVSSVDISNIVEWMLPILKLAQKNKVIEIPEQDIDIATRLTIDQYFGVDGAWEELQRDGYGLQVYSLIGATGIKKQVAYRVAYYHHSQVLKLEGEYEIKGS